MSAFIYLWLYVFKLEKLKDISLKCDGTHTHARKPTFIYTESRCQAQNVNLKKISIKIFLTSSHLLVHLIIAELNVIERCTV